MVGTSGYLKPTEHLENLGVPRETWNTWRPSEYLKNLGVPGDTRNTLRTSEYLRNLGVPRDLEYLENFGVHRKPLEYKENLGEKPEEPWIIT